MTNIPNRRRSHNATNTQLESWEDFKNSPGRRTQEKRVIIYLTDKVANSRQISNDLKIERTSITRTLSDLLLEGFIKIAYEAKCPITQRLTQFYTVIKQSPKLEENLEIEMKSIQAILFKPENQL